MNRDRVLHQVRRRAPLLAWLFLVAMGSLGFYQLAEQRHDACVDRNHSTRESALAVANALIENAPNATPEQVDAFLGSLDKELVKVQVDC